MNGLLKIYLILACFELSVYGWFWFAGKAHAKNRCVHGCLFQIIGKWDNEQAMQEAVYKLIEEENILFEHR